MAFRKTVRSHYFPLPISSGFGEVKFGPSSSNGSSISMSRSFEDASKISASALPLFSANDVVSSGEMIKGSVSYAPSDPAVRDQSVLTTVSDYVSRVKSSSSDSSGTDS